MQYPHGCDHCEVPSCKMDIPIAPPRMEEKYIYHSQRRLLRSIWTTWRCQGHLAVHVPKGLLPNRGTVKDPAAPALGAPHGAQDGLVTSVHQLLVLAVTLWWIKFSEGSTMITSSNPTAESTSPSPELSLDIFT